METNGNKDALDLAGFQMSLAAKKGLARENQIPYLLRWVQQFLWHCRGRLQDVSADTVLTFRRMLEKETRLEDWQVRQAENAVTIYLHQFLKLDLSASQGRAATGSEPGADGTHRLLTWSIAIEQAKAGLRLRHYSYHTEKTYLAWIGGFANYTDSIGPADVGTKDVKHFLTHLAVKRRVSASRACRFSHREGLRGRRRSNT